MLFQNQNRVQAAHLSHVPPGRMSAGVTASLSLVFTPKTNEGVAWDLPLDKDERSALGHDIREAARQLILKNPHRE